LCQKKGKVIGRSIQIAFRQPKNLRKIVTGCKSQLGGEGGQNINSTPLAEAGCFKCNHCSVSCPVLVETQKFRSSNTGKIYRIRQRISCDNSFVIYLATCKKCRGQYVGKSETPFKRRHSNHKQEIKHGKGGIGQHYGPKGRCSYKDVSIVLIEQVEVGNKVQLAKHEQYWQHQLRAFVENGGNAQCIKKEIV